MLRTVVSLTLFLSLLACATQKDWAVSGAERKAGLVRVSYEFPEYREPAVSETAARELALQRCEGWGYDDAQPIPGQLRQCSNMNDGNCQTWKVTREYQCTHEVAQAAQLAR